MPDVTDSKIPAPSAADIAEIRARKNRENVARHKARMDALSPLERAAWKARAKLGENYDPYTPAERARLEKIRELTAALESEAEGLHADVTRRLEASVGDKPELAALLGALSTRKAKRIDLPPH